MENTGQYPVEKMCKCMKVSKNAYYSWLRRHKAGRGPGKAEALKKDIRRVFVESKEIYGSLRIQKQLEREGVHYSRSYIALLMQKMGLRSVLRRKFIATTDSKHPFPVKDNVLDRDFGTVKLGEKWVSDITYVRVADNWNYLTTIMDLADRKIVGWSLSDDMTTEKTVIKAWTNARKNRDITDGFVFHSDRGSQYAANKTSKMFEMNFKARQSMSRKGNCWDNAVAESFFKSIKHEWLYRFKYSSRSDLAISVNEYITWYNTKRLHSSLGYLSPLEMELKLRGLYKKTG